jgi:hypothetical protein
MRLKKIIAATFVSTSAIATSAAADDGPISFLSRVIGPGVDRSAPPDTGGTRFRSSSGQVRGLLEKRAGFCAAEERFGAVI